MPQQLPHREPVIKTDDHAFAKIFKRCRDIMSCEHLLHVIYGLYFYQNLG